MTTPRISLLSLARTITLAAAALLFAACHCTHRSAPCRHEGRCCMQGHEQRQDCPQRRAPRQEGCQQSGGAAHDCRDCRGDCGGGVYFDDGRDGGERVDRRDVPGAGAGQQAREERETNDRVHLEIFERLDRLTERVTELEKKLRPAPAERAPAERAPTERRRIGR